MSLRQLLCVLLGLQLAALQPGVAQQPPKPSNPADAAGMLQRLKIYVLQGQNALNEIGHGPAAPTVVEVRDDNDRPLEGASVIFRLPPTGPGGTFADGKLTVSGRTNQQGQVAMTGFVPNNQAGSYSVKVTASLRDMLGNGSIEQRNVTNLAAAVKERKRSFWSRWKWPIIAGVAAGVGVGIWAGTRGDSSTTAAAPPVITIKPGPVVIGGPN